MDSASKVVIDVLAEKILYLEYANDLMRAENDRLREKLEEKKDQQLEVADRKVNANASGQKASGSPCQVQK